MTAESLITSPAVSDRISTLIDQLREVYFGYFDNFFFVSLLEQNSFNATRLRTIQNMLSIQMINSAIDSMLFTEGIETLDEIITISRRYIIPELRDKLEISGFYRSKVISKDERVRRQLFSCTFPQNLQQLEELTAELKKALKSHE